jgi:hypothetical protein
MSIALWLFFVACLAIGAQGLDGGPENLGFNGFCGVFLKILYDFAEFFLNFEKYRLFCEVFFETRKI